MSDHTFSDDDETVNQYQQPNLQNLLNQNKMKDLALKKATNLIDLLHIELEVQKNSSQEAIRVVEERLKYKYQTEIRKLNDKVQLLERQIRRKTQKSQANEISGLELNKTIRHQIMQRANSVQSLQNKKKKSINKKYAQKSVNQSAQKQRDVAVWLFGNSFYKQQLLKMQEFKNSMLNDLNIIVKQQYEQLGGMLNQIQSSSDDFQELLVDKAKSNVNMIENMTQIIKSQQILINSLKVYAMQLQDMYKHLHFKLQTSTNREIYLPNLAETLHFEEGLSQAKIKIKTGKQNWQRELSGLQAQNSELKSILDNMIRLVRQEKRMRS